MAELARPKSDSWDESSLAVSALSSPLLSARDPDPRVDSEGSTDVSARPSAERSGSRPVEMSSLPLLEMKLEARFAALEAALEKRCSALEKRCSALESKVSLLARTAVRDTACMQKQLQELAQQVEATTFLLVASRDLEASKHPEPFGRESKPPSEAFPRGEAQDMWQQLKAWCDRRYQTIPPAEAEHESLAIHGDLVLGARDHLSSIHEADFPVSLASSEDRPELLSRSSAASPADPAPRPDDAAARAREAGAARAASSPSLGPAGAGWVGSSAQPPGYQRSPSPIQTTPQQQGVARSPSPTQRAPRQMVSSPQVCRRASLSAQLVGQPVLPQGPRGSAAVPQGVQRQLSQQPALAPRTGALTPAGPATPARAPGALACRSPLPAARPLSELSRSHASLPGPPA